MHVGCQVKHTLLVFGFCNNISKTQDALIMWFVHNLMQMCITHKTIVPYAHAWFAADFFPSKFNVIQQTMDRSHAVILDSKVKDTELT